MQNYVSLHTHSQHGSYLDGYSTPESIMKRASEIGMSAVALTDHGEVAGHLRFQKMGQKYGVKPIFGMEGYLVDSVQRVRDEKDRENSHFCVFAENEIGLKNLWALSTRAYLEGRYYKPLVDWDMLQGNTEGLIFTDGCLLAYMARAIIADDNAKVEQLIGRYIDTFGEDNFFMELHTWQFTDPDGTVVNAKTLQTDFEINAVMCKVNQGKVKIAKKYGIPLIVVNDAHYTNEQEWEHHALIWQMSTFGDDKTESGRTASWIMTDDEIYYWMSKHGIERDVVQEAIENTNRIAQRCNVTITGSDHLPTLTGTAEGDTELFLSILEKGFKERITDKGLDEAKYMERLEEELPFIVPKGFDGYFNVVADYCLWAKNDVSWLVGPGRGSAGGSLVAYLMHITEVDPVKYNLMFSRFISPGRKSNPDIDLDFPQSKRPELVKGYLPKKYGEGNVSGIGTLSRLGPKGILKDLCRAMEVPFDDAKAMTEIIEQVEGIEDEESTLSFDELIASKGGDLAKWARQYPELFDYLKDMTGMIRQSSSHASGILISNEALLGNMPLRIKGDGGQPISQFENSETAGDTEVLELGYEKFDILGLRHLDTLMVFRELVQERHGEWLDFYNWTDEQYADPAIWEEPNNGDTLGLFQIETNSAAPVAAQFNIANQWDMADLISVNRPGVIKAGMLDEFLKRRSGAKPVKSIHTLMDELLEPTFGVVVYQEQVIRIVQAVAQYTGEEADDVRKMMGKKLMDKMLLEKPKFIQACCDNPEFVRLLKRGENAQQVAQKIWDNIEPSAGYSFNQAHAIAYGMIGCWEAWGRHYYPQEFMTALMVTDPGKVPAYVGWCKKKHIAILPPDINDSDRGFRLTDDGIRYGLTTVMNVGDKAYEEIAEKRPFSSFEDLMARVSKGGFNSRVGGNLISIGALDRWGPREVLLGHFYTERKVKDKSIPDFYDDIEVGQIEKKLVGSYITKDPTDKFADIIERECFQTAQDMNSLLPAEIGNVGGLVVAIRNYRAKTGPMCWMTVEWHGEKFELTVFPDTFKKYKYFLKEDTPVICQVERLRKGVQVRDLVRLDRL